MVIYKATASSFHHPDMGTYVSYGIRAVDKESGEILETVEDVFTNEEEAVALAARCTVGQLAVYQLKDVIEDTLI